MSATISGGIIAGLVFAYAAVVLLTESPEEKQRRRAVAGLQGDADLERAQMPEMAVDSSIPMRHFRMQGRGREGLGAVPNSDLLAEADPKRVTNWAHSRIERDFDVASYDDPAYGVGSRERQAYLTGGARAMVNPRAGRADEQPVVKHAFNVHSL